MPFARTTPSFQDSRLPTDTVLELSKTPYRLRPCTLIPGTTLVRPLHFVVSLDCLLVRWWYLCPLSLSPPGILHGWHGALLLTGELLAWCTWSNSTISTLLLSPLSLRRTVLLDVVVCHRTVLSILLRKLVVCVVGIFCDDVPGVKQAGKETETAECEIDQAVSGADAALDPY